MESDSLSIGVGLWKVRITKFRRNRIPWHAIRLNEVCDGDTRHMTDNKFPVIDVATNVLPRKAGADAAVIGGVVAVAVFVLIITIILLLRYFLSHKGEYYTHELKANEEDPASELSDNDEDDGLPRTEADLLGEKKRTEHFL